MFGLLIKKWFFDLWDNLLPAFILNAAVGFFVLGVPLVLAPWVGGFSSVAGQLIYALSILVVYVAVGIINGYTWRMSKGERCHISALGDILKRGFRQSLALGLINVVLFEAVGFAIRFYGKQNDAISGIMTAILIWATIFWVFMLQYFFPINAQLDTKLSKLFRKSALIFMDNTLFSFGIAIGSIVIIVISAITLSLFPGIVGLVLWQQTALKLRLYKYDHLEANPNTPKNAIPWDHLLREESDRIGHRTLKGMFFPWRD